MHDKNPQVQKVCDATLDIISQIDEQWAERVQREKFQFHNAQWLEVIQAQTGVQDHNPIDEFEQLVQDSKDLDIMPEPLRPDHMIQGMADLDLWSSSSEYPDEEENVIPALEKSRPSSARKGRPRI